MTRALVETSEVADVIDRARMEIVTQWSLDLKSGAYARYAERPLDELESTCQQCFDALVAVLRHGDYTRLHRFIRREVRTRVSQGFRASEIARQISLFKVIAWPIVTEQYLSRPFALSTALAKLRNSVDQALFELADVYQHVAQQQVEEYLAEMEAMNRRLEELSVRDPLTGLYNRRYFQDRLSHEFHRAKRHYRPLGLLMVDVDHFKQVNDTYGHQAGDQVLRGISLLLVNQTRATDITARFGGEEFAAVLPETDRDGAMCAAEKLREAIAVAPLHRAEPADGAGETVPIFCTVSIGVACYEPESVPDTAHLIQAADAAVYAAKASGRNRVVAAWSLPRPRDGDERFVRERQ